jgi:hypothetical protein
MSSSTVTITVEGHVWTKYPPDNCSYPVLTSIFPISHQQTTLTLRSFFGQNEKIFPDTHAHTDSIRALVPQGIRREPDVRKHRSSVAQPVHSTSNKTFSNTTPILPAQKLHPEPPYFLASSYCKLCCLIFNLFLARFLLSEWPDLHRWRLGCTTIVHQ